MTDTEYRCNFAWPQTEAEKAKNCSDCDHSCRLPNGHDGPHRCGDGATMDGQPIRPIIARKDATHTEYVQQGMCPYIKDKMWCNGVAGHGGQHWAMYIPAIGGITRMVLDD